MPLCATPADVGEVLDGLVDGSLVVRDRTASGMRHRLLETMRVVALEESEAVERRTSSPFLATDVCVAVAYAAFRSVEPEIALLALGALGQGGQRTLGAFCWRRWLYERLRPLVDDERAAVRRGEGATLSPRDALNETLRRLRPAGGGA